MNKMIRFLVALATAMTGSLAVSISDAQIPKVSVVSARGSHSCALLSGGVRCWGDNRNGQLGNNSTVDGHAPVQAIPAGSKATAVSAGFSHTCAVVDGGVQCWGANFNGQLGNNSTAESHVPVPVISAGSGATAVYASDVHTCAVIDGGVQCWGNNLNGQLGNNSTVNSLVPVQAIPAGSGATQVTGGLYQSCAVVGGGVQCWGYNGSGQLGNNSTNDSHVPVQTVAAGSSVTDLSSGFEHTCAVMSGGVKCWGLNDQGQVGNNSTTNALAPVQIVAPGSNASSVAAGDHHTCAVASGGVQCWGLNNRGQYGNDNTANSRVPVQAIAAQSGMTAVAAGSSHTCAVANGGVQCWGFNGSGQIGDNSTTERHVPTQAIRAVPLSLHGGIDVDGSNRGQILLGSNGSQGLAHQIGRLVDRQFQFTASVTLPTGFRDIAVGDFAGNGISDLAAQNIGQGESGDVVLRPDFADSAPLLVRAVKLPWIVEAVADLDGDGRTDMAFRFTGDDGVPNDTGVSYIWFMRGETADQVRKRGGAPLSWTLLGAADINGDYAADMVYISPANDVRVLMATPSRTCANLSAGTLPTGSQVLKLADFTGRGLAEILYRNPAGGVLQMLTLDATALTLPAPSANPDDPNASCTSSNLQIATKTIPLPAVDPAWQFYASGDLDGDGRFDIVWKQPNGTLTVWLMGADGGAPDVIANAGTAPVGYVVVQP